MAKNTSYNPAEYHRNCARQAEKLRLVGATRAELGLHFGVDVSTLERWEDEHKDFEWALQVAPSVLSATPEDAALLNWLKDYRLGNLDI